MTPPSELGEKLRNTQFWSDGFIETTQKKVLNIGQIFCSSQTVVHHFDLHKFLKIGLPI